MKNKNVLFSFKYAYEGLYEAFKTERNLRIQLIIGIIGFILGLLFQITDTEWIMGILTFTLVFSLELTNTAIEEIINGFTDNFHPSAKRAKDIASAAVFVALIAELIVGLLIFLPYIWIVLTVLV